VSGFYIDKDFMEKVPERDEDTRLASLALATFDHVTQKEPIPFVWRYDTQHDDIQHNNTQNNDTQHNYKLNVTLNIISLIIMARHCCAEYHK